MEPSNKSLAWASVAWRTPRLARACRYRIIILLLVSATALELSGVLPINKKDRTKLNNGVCFHKKEIRPNGLF